jgi:RNA polymerase sigma-B factor
MQFLTKHLNRDINTHRFFNKGKLMTRNRNGRLNQVNFTENARESERLSDMKLIRRIQEGDRRALNELITKHSGYAQKQARKAQALYGDEYDDLCQEALLGLMGAIPKNDPELSYSFATKAHQHVWGNMRRYLANHSRTVRIPCYCRTRYNQLKAENIAEKADGIDGEIIQAMQAKTISIDSAADMDSRESVGHLTNTESAREAENDVLSLIDTSREINQLRVGLRQLQERQRHVLWARFIRGQTLSDTAVSLSRLELTHKIISHQAVRKIEKRALANLAKILKRRKAQSDHAAGEKW